MEKDHTLKELLLQGSEPASPHFTESVMERVHKLSATPFYYQPLVSPSLKRAFIIVVSVLVTSIFLLCLLIAAPDLPSTPAWIAIGAVITFIYSNSYTILAYIVCFWLIFLANSFVERRVMRKRTAHF